LPRACSEHELPAAAADGIRIAVRLTPHGRADRIEGIVHSANGRPAVKVSVTAPPVEGRANDALVLLLAKQWSVPKRDLAIVAGQKSRDKIVHIAGDPAALLSHIGPLIAALPTA
jgi:uncharacterized protein (TIGR00251 family)